MARRQLHHGMAFRAVRPGAEGRRPYVIVEVLSDEVTYREIWQLPEGFGQWEAGVLRMNDASDFDGFEQIPAPPAYRLAKTVRPAPRDSRARTRAPA